MKYSLKIMRLISIWCIILFAINITSCGKKTEEEKEASPNTPPTASITSPMNWNSFLEGDAITFSGTGEDAEDGTLTGDSLVWTTDLEGEIGTGASITRDDLPFAGVRTVTLTATDSNGATGSDSISIVVTRP